MLPYPDFVERSPINIVIDFFFKFKLSKLNFIIYKYFFSVYIETGGQTPAATFTITTSAALFNTRMWNVSNEIFYIVGKLK